MINSIGPATAVLPLRRMVVRKAQDDKIFYQGKYYAADEWKDQLKAGQIDLVEAQTLQNRGISLAADTPPTVGEIMNFTGAAPELTNARLAMVGFVAAFVAELFTGVPAAEQASLAPVSVMSTILLFVMATLIPVAQNVKNEAFGPFSPKAELLNGRIAMVAFFTLIVVEAVRGGALF